MNALKEVTKGALLTGAVSLFAVLWGLGLVYCPLTSLFALFALATGVFSIYAER